MSSDRVTEARPAAVDQSLSSDRQSFWQRYRVLILLVGILAIGAYFRFNGREFDQGTSQHPDERTVASRVQRVHWPGPGENLFNPLTSPMNLRAAGMEDNCPATPCEYPYGALPIYLTKAAGWLVDSFTPAGDPKKGYYLNDFYGVTVMGRNLSSIFDLITVLLVFLIGRRLFSSSTGLIAAALVAFSVTNIQLAHFTTVDSFLTTFMIAALYFSVVMMQHPSWRAAIGAGACIGFAVATKVSVVPFALIIVAAVVLRAAYRKQTRKLGAEFGAPIGLKPASAAERARSFWGHFWRGFIYLPIAGVASLAAFGIAEPYVLWQFDFSRFSQGGIAAVLDSNTWWTRIVKESDIQRGTADIVYTRQYVGTVPILYHLQNMVFWGLSPIPGLVTLVGFVAGMWRALRAKPAEILLLSAALPYFASLLILEAKWMRYMLPLVPIFCIMGAAFLVRGHIWVQRRVSAFRRAGAPATSRRRPILPVLQRNIFAILTIASVLGGFLWAVAFSNIYGQEHSRVQASEWIDDNVAPGVLKTHEAWDDSLPLGIRTRPAGVSLRDEELDIYGDPPPDQKFEYLKTELAKVDYIFIASNRLYGSVARLPWRYPTTIQFYNLLFAGKLGFQLVHTDHVTPSLFGIQFDDQSADESFTVYDHPRVDIFKKTSNLTDDQLRTLFEPALDRPAGDFQSVRHGKVTDDKPLTYSEPIASLPDVGDFAWNPLAQENTQWIAVLLWLIAAEILGFAALPIIFVVCRNLPDRGYAFAKILGLLLVSWGAWIAASTRMIPFTVWSILLMLAIMLGLSALCWRLGAGRQIREFFATKSRLVLFYELLFFAAFAAFLFLRVLDPDLWQPTLGGEKPMEFGFLNSILRSPWMPPLDPFFSGGYINYYYHGYVILSTLIKLVGVDPAIAFNLAIPLLYALTFTAGASVVYNIVAWSQKRRGSTHQVSGAGMAFGVLAGVLMLAIGNMNGLWQFIMVNFPQWRAGMSNWARSAGFTMDSMVAQYASYNFWDPRSIIPGTINEFPYWTFLFADLHPHLIDMAFTIFTAGLSLNIAFSGALRSTSTKIAERAEALGFVPVWDRVKNALGWLWGEGWAGALRFAIMALALGVLAVTNSWDFPTYAGLTFAAVLVALFCAKPARSEETVIEQAQDSPAATVAHTSLADIGTAIVTSLVTFGALAVVALLAYLPFFLSFKAFFTQILPLVDGGTLPAGGTIMQRTTLGEFLVFWFIFVFIALSFLVYRLFKFPWSRAFSELGSLLGSSQQDTKVAVSPQHAFRSESQDSRNPRAPLFPRRSPLTLATASAGSAGPSFKPAQFSLKTDVSESDEAPPKPPSNQTDGEEAEGVTDGSPLLDADNLFEGLDSGSRVDATAGVADARHEALPISNGELVDLDGVAPLPENGTHADTGTWLSHSTNGNGTISDLENSPYFAPPISWVAEAHALPQEETAVKVHVPMEGAIPAWAGLVLLGITGALVVLQIVTRQNLLALLILLIGGIIATTLASRRSAPAYFGSTLLVVGLLVAMAVELVYLADHLQYGDTYRMNTVFKFYTQVWVLLAMGGAAAIYYILFGLRESKRVSIADATLLSSAATDEPVVRPVEAVPVESPLPLVVETADEAVMAEGHHESEVNESILSSTHSTDNWLIWAGSGPLDASQLEDESEVAPIVQLPAPPVAVQPAPDYVVSEGRDRFKLRWTWWRVAWSALFVLVLLGSMVYTVVETPVRVNYRFDNPPPIGTLNGQKYMTVASVNNSDAAPFPMQLNYDYEAIRWMNQNIHGEHVIAERQLGYYREYGMRAASNTGFPMVVGGLHQEEQRYGWQVGPRRGEMDDFFKTTDVQRALILISKYDIDYIYMGQMEQALAGGGAAKFKQMADPKVGILRQVFRIPDDPEIPGTTIYQVIRNADTITGSPVEGSGIVGISLTPVPTLVPTPAPTPPTDDPTLKVLLDDSRANPQDMDKRGKLANWYRDHGFHEYAANEMEAMTKLDPTSVGLRHQWGDELQAAGKPDEALKAWASAVDIAPNEPAAHNKLGIAYLDRRQYDKARDEFEATVRLNEKWSEGWFHLGETYERLGKPDDARKAYQSAIDKAEHPDTDDWARNARQRLNDMR